MTWYTPANQGAVGDDMSVGCRCCDALVGETEDASLLRCEPAGAEEYIPADLLKLPQLGRAITDYIREEERMKCP